jgi:hypothetical protein
MWKLRNRALSGDIAALKKCAELGISTSQNPNKPNYKDEHFKGHKKPGTKWKKRKQK